MSAEVDGFSNDDTTQVDEWVELWYNKYGYNGEAHTAEGLQYLRSRYYDPVTGSFISADSYRGEFSNLLSQNRYTYAHNNPYKYDDPTGHLPASGINKYVANAYMDVGSGTNSNSTVKPLPKKTTSSIPTEGYRATNIDEAHARNQQNAFTGSFTLLGSTNKAPVKDTVVPKEESKATGEQERESIGTVTTIVTEPHDNTQPYGVETYEIQNTETKVVDVKDMTKALLAGAILVGAGMLGGALMSMLGGAILSVFGVQLASVVASFPVVSGYLQSVGAATAMGFAFPIVQAITKVAVEGQTIKEYAKLQGETEEVFLTNLMSDAQSGAMMGMLSANLLYIFGDLINPLVNKSNITNVADDTLDVAKDTSEASLKKVVVNKDDVGVWDMPEGGSVINGREYSQHALERMAPDTISVRAELGSRAEMLANSKGLQVGTEEYYEFVQKYVDPRNIPPSVIEDAILNTTSVPGKMTGTFVHQTVDVTVVVNETGKVVTVIPK